MNDPYKINDLTVVSFSGGRSSAYMLWKVLQSNGGLPKDARVCFANTGKEMEETLNFVNDCAINWNVPIVWLEYISVEPFFKVVTYETASRNGEPFEELIRFGPRQYLPNPLTRYCTVDLKIKTAQKYCFSIGWEEWDNLVGIRADEPRRVAKIRANPSNGNKGITRFMPLADDGVTKQDISNFWSKHTFDLELPNNNGITYHGNCDLCFLKKNQTIYSLIKEKPERAVWWAKMETVFTNPTLVNGDKFRKDRPEYKNIAEYIDKQKTIFDPNEEDIACFCGD